MLPALPIELYNSLNSYLEPPDYVALSQTCCRLRNVYRHTAWEACLLVAVPTTTTSEENPLNSGNCPQSSFPQTIVDASCNKHISHRGYRPEQEGDCAEGGGGDFARLLPVHVFENPGKHRSWFNAGAVKKLVFIKSAPVSLFYELCGSMGSGPGGGLREKYPALVTVTFQSVPLDLISLFSSSSSSLSHNWNPFLPYFNTSSSKSNNLFKPNTLSAPYSFQVQCPYSVSLTEEDPALFSFSTVFPFRTGPFTTNPPTPNIHHTITHFSISDSGFRRRPGSLVGSLASFRFTKLDIAIVNPCVFRDFMECLKGMRGCRLMRIVVDGIHYGVNQEGGENKTRFTSLFQQFKYIPSSSITELHLFLKPLNGDILEKFATEEAAEIMRRNYWVKSVGRSSSDNAGLDGHDGHDGLDGLEVCEKVTTIIMHEKSAPRLLVPILANNKRTVFPNLYNVSGVFFKSTIRLLDTLESVTTLSLSIACFHLGKEYINPITFSSALPALQHIKHLIFYAKNHYTFEHIHCSKSYHELVQKFWECRHVAEFQQWVDDKAEHDKKNRVQYDVQDKRASRFDASNLDLLVHELYPEFKNTADVLVNYIHPGNKHSGTEQRPTNLTVNIPSLKNFFVIDCAVISLANAPFLETVRFDFWVCEQYLNSRAQYLKTKLPKLRFVESFVPVYTLFCCNKEKLLDGERKEAVCRELYDQVELNSKTVILNV